MNNFCVQNLGVYGINAQFLAPSLNSVEVYVAKSDEKEEAALSPMDLKGERSGTWDAFCGFPLFMICNFCVALIVYLFIGLFASGAVLDRVQSEMLLLLLFCNGLGAAIISAWKLIAWVRKGKCCLNKIFGFKKHVEDIGFGLIGCMSCIGAGIVGGFLWYMLTGGKDLLSNNSFIRGFEKTSVTHLSVFFLIVVLAPVVEEVFFRGLLLRALVKRGNVLIAIFLSSLAFGLLHVFLGSNVRECLFFFGVTSAYGMIFACLAVYREGRIGSSIVAHSFVSALGLI